jgi:hypothetical protein
MEDVNKFYDWLLKVGSVHLADNNRMDKAYQIVYNNSIDLRKPKGSIDLRKKKCTQSI